MQRIKDDDFPGPNQRFAVATARRAFHAAALETRDEPWPAWSSREIAAVALVLMNRPILHEDGFRTFSDAAKFVSDGLEFPFDSDREAMLFFAAIRARVESEFFQATWEAQQVRSAQ